MQLEQNRAMAWRESMRMVLVSRPIDDVPGQRCKTVEQAEAARRGYDRKEGAAAIGESPLLETRQKREGQEGRGAVGTQGEDAQRRRMTFAHSTNAMQL